MTHSINPFIIFEERAANKMENGFTFLSLYVEREGTRSFSDQLPEVHFLGFHACAVSGFPKEVSGSLTGNKWNKNETSFKHRWKTVKNRKYAIHRPVAPCDPAFVLLASPGSKPEGNWK